MTAADRLAAPGGTPDIRAQPGLGTTITGRLPAPTAGHGPGGNGARRATDVLNA